MESHEIDYKILGEGIQMVEIELDPGETVIAEAGAMVYMEDGITFATKMGDGTNPKAGLFDKLYASDFGLGIHFARRRWSWACARSGTRATARSTPS